MPQPRIDRRGARYRFSVQHISGLCGQPYHPHSICMAASKHVPSAIRHGRYAALWLEIPRSARPIPISKRPAVFNELALWVRTARMSGVPACLVGLRGVAWQNEHLARLVTDRVIYESRHQLCHYGLAMIDTNQPSRVSYHAFTTFSAESGLCRCPHPRIQQERPALHSAPNSHRS